jgi:hypothetical protein
MDGTRSRILAICLCRNCTRKWVYFHFLSVYLHILEVRFEYKDNFRRSGAVSTTCIMLHFVTYKESKPCELLEVLQSHKRLELRNQCFTSLRRISKGEVFNEKESGVLK